MPYYIIDRFDLFKSTDLGLHIPKDLIDEIGYVVFSSYQSDHDK